LFLLHRHPLILPEKITGAYRFFLFFPTVSRGPRARVFIILDRFLISLSYFLSNGWPCIVHSPDPVFPAGRSPLDLLRRLLHLGDAQACFTTRMGRLREADPASGNHDDQDASLQRARHILRKVRNGCPGR
jgi:hypothetical protein